MSEKSKHQKIREIIYAKNEEAGFEKFMYHSIGRSGTGEVKPLTTRGEKRVFKGDDRIYQAMIYTWGIDEETIKSFRKKLNKRRLRLDTWKLEKAIDSDKLALVLRFYSVY